MFYRLDVNPNRVTKRPVKAFGRMDWRSRERELSKLGSKHVLNQAASWADPCGPETFREDLVAERGEHGANLVQGDDVAIEVGGIAGKRIVELFPADFARLALAFVHVESTPTFGPPC
jgi:hypothetical protein